MVDHFAFLLISIFSVWMIGFQLYYPVAKPIKKGATKLHYLIDYLIYIQSRLLLIFWVGMLIVMLRKYMNSTLIHIHFTIDFSF